MTEFPESMMECTDFTLKELETQLRIKIDAMTTKDSDRFRQVLKVWREQGKKKDAKTGQRVEMEKDGHSALQPKEFAHVLKILGLFATRAQSDALFVKYDSNGDGQLTCYEFFRKCRGVDYYKRNGEMEDFPVPPPIPPKIDRSRSRLGAPLGATAPWSDIGILEALRKKFAGMMTTVTASGVKSRRQFCMLFEYADKELLRYVDEPGLRRTFASINFTLRSNFIKHLMFTYQATPKKGETVPLFNYPAFILDVFPASEDQSTSTSFTVRSMERQALKSAARLPKGPSRAMLRGRAGKTGALTARVSRPPTQPRPPSSRSGALTSRRAAFEARNSRHVVRIVGGRLVKVKVDPAKGPRMGHPPHHRVECALQWDAQDNGGVDL
jgi:hypothetical protein